MLYLGMILLITILLLIYVYLKRVVYSYWKVHQIPHDKPSLLIGTIHKELIMQKMSMGTSCEKSYEKFKIHPFHGLYMFLNPVLMVNDPDLINDILIKNFQNFPDRGLYSNEKIDPLTGNLFLLSGEKWKTLRMKFTSMFTPKKLKEVFPLLTEVADETINVFNEKLMKSDIFDIKDLIGRYTTDSIFNLAFGFNSNTMRNSESIFRYYGDLILKVRPLRNALAFCAPEVLNFFRMNFLNPKASQFFIKLFQDMIHKRKLEREKRNDLLNVIIEMMEKEQVIENDIDDYSIMDNTIRANASRKLNVMEAAAQALVFYVGGFETSSATVTFCLYELAVNPDIQEKLFNEIHEFQKSSEVLTMKNLNQLEYLDMVFNETLRKHPVLAILNRICMNDYKIKNSDYCIPKGTRILISLSGIHSNPDFYPNPNKFDPTRFNKENTAARHPSTFIPFGSGPRFCIGKRLGIIQSKLILFKLIFNYQFSVCEETMIPIQYSINSFLQTPRHPVYLRVQKRKN